MSNLAQGACDLTVLVTCYNEEDLIAQTLQSVIDAVTQAALAYEILVIDDVSKDHSVERVQNFINAHPDYPIRLWINQTNRGLANNYVDGAFLGRGTYYHLVCGDDSIPVQYLAAIYGLLGKADMIVPYQLQDEVAGKSRFRKSVSLAFTRLVSLLSGYNLKYFNGSAVQRRYNVMRWHPVSYGFGFQADILTMLLDQGVSYIQVYSRGIDRKGGRSTALSMRNFLSVSHTLLEILFRRVRRLLYGKNWPLPTEIIPPVSEVRPRDAV
jgi:glycosyltransferase involved in cell wall biosynthesis